MHFSSTINGEIFTEMIQLYHSYIVIALKKIAAWLTAEEMPVIYLFIREYIFR